VYQQQEQQQQEQQQQQDAENPFLDPPFSRIKTTREKLCDCVLGGDNNAKSTNIRI
jgi:hypothetical protein